VTVRFVLLDYVDSYQQTRMSCLLTDADGTWAVVDGTVAPWSPLLESTVLESWRALAPGDVFELRRLSLPDLEPLRGDGARYWLRAQPV
jgi:hypothetical protein